MPNYSFKDFVSTHSLLIFCGSMSALMYCYLASSSQAYGDAQLFHLFSVSLVCAALCFITWFHYWRVEQELPVIPMIAFALLFRFIGLFTYPILEDDMFRFLWDGWQTVEFGTPYEKIPLELINASDGAFGEASGAIYINERFSEILSFINNPNIATIYGPVCQWVFAGAYLIAPGEIWPLQLLFGIADVAVILILLKLAKPLYVLLYAWSPLIIKEFVITAHPDVLGAAFLMLGFYGYQQKRYILVGVCLALAAGVKIFALILLPALLGLQWRGWLAFVITAVAIALPLGLIEAWFPAGLKAMSGDWLFNSPLYILLAPWFSIAQLKLVLLPSLLLGCGFYYLYLLKHWPVGEVRGDLIFAALFICTPVLNAWYLVWLLPFAVIYPSLWGWLASFSILLAYATGINLNDPELGLYQHRPWVVAIEFGVIALAVIVQSRLTPFMKHKKSTAH